MPIEPATVTLTLGGKPYVLTPTLPAMRAAGRLAGGFAPLFRGLADANPDLMAGLLIAGTDARGERANDIEAAMYAEGIDRVLPSVVEFATLCANGGRRPAPVPAAEVGADQAAEVGGIAHQGQGPVVVAGADGGSDQAEDGAAADHAQAEATPPTLEGEVADTVEGSNALQADETPTPSLH